jgi:hypothetical protein
MGIRFGHFGAQLLFHNAQILYFPSLLLTLINVKVHIQTSWIIILLTFSNCYNIYFIVSNYLGSVSGNILFGQLVNSPINTKII